MRRRVFVLAVSFLTVASQGSADTVIDASKEWKAHASSGTVASPAVIPPAAVLTPSLEPDNPACDCETLTPHERLEQSTLAFTGRVEEASTVKKGRRTIVFDVAEVFKGTPGTDPEVLVDVTGTSCDYPFDVGQSYLVFTHWEWGRMMTSRCLGTKYLEKAKVSALGPDQEKKEKLYVDLHNLCMGRRDTSCCLASLKAMSQDYYVPEPDAGCSDGTVPDRLHCSGSYTWCIPLTEKGHQ